MNRKPTDDGAASARSGYSEMVRNRLAAAHGTKTVYIRTFGCQQNEADSERLAGMALDMGYERTDDPGTAALIIVNTCAVREHAERRALSIIGQYKHCKKNNPEMIIAVCGCMVSQSHRADELKISYPYVDFTFGTSDLHRFPELLWKRLSGGGRRFLLPEDEPVTVEGIPVSRVSSYRAWVSIMYGCNNFCSYCIVPYVRGRERSRRPEDIEAEVRGLVSGGCREITLLGQNVNSYGRNCDFDCDFAGLLTRLSAIDGDYRLHFMTSHPKDATRALIDAMAAGLHIAHQFHLPAQSGSDAVLRAMNRGYTAEKYTGTVEYLRRMIPDVVISSDIIVGFPGESDADFEATLDMLRTVEFDMIYSFIYSPRVGTPAAAMTEQVPDEVKKDRMERLLELQTGISEKKNRQAIGSVLRVLCCGPSKSDPGVLEGRTDGNKIVLFGGDGSCEGKFVNIEITDARAFALYGRIPD